MTVEQNFDAEGHQLDGTQITYADLRKHVRETRKRDLEASNPGRVSNVNAVSNTTRALTLFMEANGLNDKDVVGPELLDERIFELSLKSLIGSKDSVRRRRSELKKNVRVQAQSMVHDLKGVFKNESFGERLERLRISAGFSQLELARSHAPSASREAIRDWISGKTVPSDKYIPVVISIAKKLDVDPLYLIKSIPKNKHCSLSNDTGLPSAIQRRVSKHLPANFDSMSNQDKEDVLGWISNNILSTPKEILDNGEESSGATGVEISIYTLSRKKESRSPKAPDHFISELDELNVFKTSKLVPSGMRRNTSWGEISAKRADDHLRAFAGAIHAMGLPLESTTLCLCLFPDVIDKFIGWKSERRGGYTRAISNHLELLDSLLNPDTGFITQSPHLRFNLRAFPKFFSKSKVNKITSSTNGEWVELCVFARNHIRSRIKEIEAILEKGRDPFEAILPALQSENPFKVYSKIVDEIRIRVPDQRYEKSRAEAMRSLMMIRIGLATGFRSKNMRQLLFTTDSPKTWKELKRLKRGELSFDGDNWVVRIPGSAFKNETSRAVDEENTIVIHDHDNLYVEIENYIGVRHRLLGNHEDSGTFFVKSVKKSSKSSEFCLNSYYEAFRATITTYGIYNPYTGKGAIEGLRPHGPHSIRHILATTLVKHTGGFSDAAAFLMDTEDMVRENYARFLPGERHARAQSILLQSMGDK